MPTAEMRSEGFFNDLLGYSIVETTSTFDYVVNYPELEEFRILIEGGKLCGEASNCRWKQMYTRKNASVGGR